MARILLIDETDIAERFSSTDGQLANIGSGAGTGRLTINTTIFATSSAILSSGTCHPSSVSPNNAAITVSSSTNVTTLPSSREPQAEITAGQVASVFDSTQETCVPINLESNFVISFFGNGTFTIDNNGDMINCASSNSTSTFYVYI